MENKVSLDFNRGMTNMAEKAEIRKRKIDENAQRFRIWYIKNAVGR